MNANAQSADDAFSRLDARIGMRLAYWAYEHKDIQGAEKVAKYPEPWRHAKPGVDLPVADFKALHRVPATGQVTQEGWNTQHKADGRLENQFKVSINDKTREISFDFKGSDAWSNWKSDLGNAGASDPVHNPGHKMVGGYRDKASNLPVLTLDNSGLWQQLWSQ